MKTLLIDKFSFQVEIKKAVFVENNSADEGVSLSATPASEDNAGAASASAPTSNAGPESNNEKKLSVVLDINKKVVDTNHDDVIGEEPEDDEDDPEADETRAMLEAKHNVPPAGLTSTASSSNHEQFTEHRVNAVVSQPPPEALAASAVAAHFNNASSTSDHQYFYQQMQPGPSMPTTRKSPMPAFGHPLANVLPQQNQNTQDGPLPVGPTPPKQLPVQAQRRTAPLRTLREKDVVVTHQDINGVNTVALKDLDVQMTQMSGYETYV